MSVDHEDMARCLIAEVKSRLKATKINTVTSIYFGGGIIFQIINMHNNNTLCAYYYYYCRNA